MKRVTILVTIAVVALTGLTAGCQRGGEPTTPQPTPTGEAPGQTTPAPEPTTPAPGGTEPVPGGTVRDWTSQPVTVTKQVAVPPVPRLLRIRSAQHPDEGYDRITFDFEGTLPGYDVRYVAEAIADGSGEPVEVPGRRLLQIRFTPAQAHNDAGTESVTPRSKTLNYPMMEAYAITGDFEGVVTVVIGLDDVVGFRIGELPGTPGRIYLDVAA